MDGYNKTETVTSDATGLVADENGNSSGESFTNLAIIIDDFSGLSLDFPNVEIYDYGGYLDEVSRWSAVEGANGTQWEWAFRWMGSNNSTGLDFIIYLNFNPNIQFIDNYFTGN